MLTYNFQDIHVNNISYNIQCKLIQEPQILETSATIIASLIVEDTFKNKIEILSFNASAKFIKEQKLKEKSMYCFKMLQATRNKKFRKTKHQFKLIFDQNRSKISKINCLEYKIKNRIFVLTRNKNKLKEKDSTKQLSIKHFFK